MTEPVSILGAGGHARVVLGALRAMGLNVVAVYDDDSAKQGGTLMGVPIKGRVADAEAVKGLVMPGLGDNSVRRRVTQSMHCRWATAIHPFSWVSPDAKVGEGAVICAGAIVQPGAIIGAHAIVNTGATVDHDCIVGDYAHVGPGAHLSGTVRVEEGAFIGTGASTVQGVTIGAWSTVGAGAVVIADVPAGATAVGNPARIVKPGRSQGPPQA